MRGIIIFADGLIITWVMLLKCTNNNLMDYWYGKEELRCLRSGRWGGWGGGGGANRHHFHKFKVSSGMLRTKDENCQTMRGQNCMNSNKLQQQWRQQQQERQKRNRFRISKTTTWHVLHAFLRCKKIPNFTFYRRHECKKTIFSFFFIT